MISNKPRVYSVDPIDFEINALPEREEPRKILMASPEYFDIIDVKNAHMEGQEGKLDKDRAIRQWTELRAIYEKLKDRKILEEVEVVTGAEGCEDMVFAANQTFPWFTEEGRKKVVISKMKYPSRQREVSHFENFFLSKGYDPIHLSKANLFEGMGDTIPHPGKRLLYGGYGHRSDNVAFEEISEALNVPVVTLELIDERFYHLDTCFVPLDEKSVMLYPGAFTEKGLSYIQQLFSRVIAVPVSEAAEGFALNAHVINNTFGKAVIIQKGNRRTADLLRNSGFEVFETDTSEYMKSGGSVFCMKMMYY